MRKLIDTTINKMLALKKLIHSVIYKRLTDKSVNKKYMH